MSPSIPALLILGWTPETFLFAHEIIGRAGWSVPAAFCLATIAHFVPALWPFRRLAAVAAMLLWLADAAYLFFQSSLIGHSDPVTSLGNAEWGAEAWPGYGILFMVAALALLLRSIVCDRPSPAGKQSLLGESPGEQPM